MLRESLNLKAYYPQVKRGTNKFVTMTGRTFLFNKACAVLFKHMDHCQLYYDEKQSVIAIKPLIEETERSVKIVRSHKGTPNESLRINVRAFLVEFGILVQLGLHRISVKLRRLEPEWDDKNKVLFLDLNKLKDIK